MVIKKTASAGSVTKNDCLVTVSPLDREEIEIELESIVKIQFGDQIIAAARGMVQEMGANCVHIKIEDKGSLDYVVRARTEAALRRAEGGEDQ